MPKSHPAKFSCSCSSCSGPGTTTHGVWLLLLGPEGAGVERGLNFVPCGHGSPPQLCIYTQLRCHFPVAEPESRGSSHRSPEASLAQGSGLLSPHLRLLGHTPGGVSPESALKFSHILLANLRGQQQGNAAFVPLLYSFYLPKVTHILGHSGICIWFIRHFKNNVLFLRTVMLRGPLKLLTTIPASWKGGEWIERV